jgi:hypothetical protein
MTSHVAPESASNTANPEVEFQHEAWKAQVRELAQLRAQVARRTERRALEIVEEAQNSVDLVLVRADRNLRELTSTAQAAMDECGGAADLGFVLDIVKQMQRQTRTMATEARPDLEALGLDAAALSVALNIAAGGSQNRLSATPKPAPPPAAPATSQPPRLHEIVAPSARPGAMTAPSPVPRSEELSRATYPAVGRSRHSRSGALIVVCVIGLGLGIAAWAWLRPPASGPEGSSAAIAERARDPLPPAEEPPAPPLEATAPSLPPPVTVEARRLAWIRIVVDGRETVARLFEPGERYAVEAASDVSIRAGDSGAVFVSVNGGDATALGPDGLALTRRFVVNEAIEPLGASTPGQERPDQ